jgi:hypothetical protein
MAVALLPLAEVSDLEDGVKDDMGGCGEEDVD